MPSKEKTEKKPKEKKKYTTGSDKQTFKARTGESEAVEKISDNPSPHRKTKTAAPVNDYAESVNKVRRSRIVNSILCATLCVAIVAGAIYSCFTDFVLICLCGAAALLVPLAALLVKNLREAAAVAEIAYRGVYAARMTRKQQSDVRKNQVRQGQIFYLRFFLILCIPESIVLVIMGRIFDSDVFLLIMGLFALALLSIVFVSTLYLSARLNVKHAFCTVSSHGIITSREVLPFSAKDGDVGILTKFDDYYVMTFKKIEIFGIKHDDVLIFPNDGVLKNGIEGEDAATVLAGTLGLRSYKVKPTEFVENRELYGDVKPKAAATV